MTNEPSMASTPRMRFREMMRGDILVAAREILQAGGFGALSMRSLAEAVGVRAPTLYDYFASKEDVLNAIFLDAVEIIRAYFVENVTSSDAGVARLVAMGMSYRDFAIKHPVLFQLVFTRIDSAYIPGLEQMEAAKGLFDALRIEVVAAIELGQIDPGDPDAIAIGLWASVHGLAELQLSGFMQKCAHMSSDEIAAQAITSLFYGLVPRTVADARAVSCVYPSSPAGPVAAGN